ncbi:MAG TPA: hypothetical protein VJ278_01340, partial [Chthoniobacterales bacterium]|nr:hypothetical protein [Chthoniobacterales bacterium]
FFDRVGEALKDGRLSVSDAKRKRWRFTEWSRRGASDIDGQLVRARKRERTSQTTYNWWSLGFGLAAAAVLILFAAVTMERRPEHQQTVAQSSPAPETQPVPLGTERSISPGRFVPAGGSNVVYNARDEGLHFADGSERPVRRVRYNTRQTWRWRNPETGASLRVSYPSEEIVLIPVSGQ